MKLKLVCAALLLLSSAASFDSARAEMPGRHPAYLHALSDLRAARWLIAHRPAGFAAGAHEGSAIGQIDAAMHDVKEAGIWDGKDMNFHPPVDDRGGWGGHLHRALDLLQEARGDCDHAEDDPMVRGLKHQALGHIDGAIRETQAALWDLEHRR